MTNLSSLDINAVWQFVMEDYSGDRTLIPITKSQLRALLILIDNGLESAETDIVSALPAGVGKTWLVNNASIGRDFMLYVLDKRKEVL